MEKKCQSRFKSKILSISIVQKICKMTELCLQASMNCLWNQTWCYTAGWQRLIWGQQRNGRRRVQYQGKISSNCQPGPSTPSWSASTQEGWCSLPQWRFRRRWPSGWQSAVLSSGSFYPGWAQFSSNLREGVKTFLQNPSVKGGGLPPLGTYSMKRFWHLPWA